MYPKVRYHKKQSNRGCFDVHGLKYKFYYLDHPVNVKVPCRKILPIQDTLEYPIIQHFDDAAEWI